VKALLITGADGWLGQSIIDCLINDFSAVKGIELIIFHSLDKTKFIKKQRLKKFDDNNIKCSFVKGSVTDDLFIRKVNKFINLKNIKDLRVIYTSSVIHPEKIIDFNNINYLGLKKFYNSLNKLLLKKFTYISSNSPFGFNKSQLLFDEKSFYNPIGEYGSSKKKAEEFLLRKKDIKRITILRAPWFHGKNMPLRQAKFLNNSAKGLFPLINKGLNKRSVVNTKDLAKAALNVTFRKTKCQVYWISDTNSYTMIGLMKIIQNSYSKAKNLKPINKIKYLNLPKGTSSLFCLFDLFLQKIGLYNKYVHILGELGQNIECSSEKYRREFKDHKWNDIVDSIDEELKEAEKIL